MPPFHLSPWNSLCSSNSKGLRKPSWACISLNPRMPFRVAAAWTTSSCLHTRSDWCEPLNRELPGTEKQGVSSALYQLLLIHLLDTGDGKVGLVPWTSPWALRLGFFYALHSFIVSTITMCLVGNLIIWFLQWPETGTWLTITKTAYSTAVVKHVSEEGGRSMQPPTGDREVEGMFWKECFW